MSIRVAVAGASGYAGGELLRLLAQHPAVELAALTASESSVGRPLAAVHPHLASLAGRTLAATTPETLAEADLVFLALPHGASGALAGQLPATVKVVDLGADHRLVTEADWSAAYGGPWAGAWTYGLPELPGARAAIAAASRVAAPGCFPTAVALALVPLVAAGLLDPADLVVAAPSGTSGAGRAAKLNLLGAEVMGDVTAYKVGSHQHRPEMVQTLRAHTDAPVGLTFTPMLAPMPRGILAVCTGRLAEAGAAPAAATAALREALGAAYAEEPLVQVLPEGLWPHTSSTVGSAGAHLQVTADDSSGRAIVVAAIDNMGKGAAAQAVQCANLMLGLPELTALSADGVAP
jgi:N-acetyl-gamma-glutamyl-phosphate reductase